MKKFIVLFVMFSFVISGSSCSLFQSNKRPVDVPYIADGINFHLRADSQLNLYQNTPHALLLCAYQLKDMIAFNQLLEDKEGMPKLMECKRFDPSVNYVKRLVVQPGQDYFEAMERTDGTKIVAIVAGYYNFDKKHAVRTIAIPMTGLPFMKKPGGLDIDLFLTSQEIQDLKKDNK